MFAYRIYKTGTSKDIDINGFLIAAIAICISFSGLALSFYSATKNENKNLLNVAQRFALASVFFVFALLFQFMDMTVNLARNIKDPDFDMMLNYGLVLTIFPGISYFSFALGKFSNYLGLGEKK